MYIPPNILFVAVAVIMLIYAGILWMIVRAKVDPTEPTRQEYEARPRLSAAEIMQRAEALKAGGQQQLVAMPPEMRFPEVMATPREGVTGQTGGTATPPEAPGTGRHSLTSSDTGREASNPSLKRDLFKGMLDQKDRQGHSLVLELEITGCSDPQMWYAKLVGQRVPYMYQDIRTLDYMSRESAGYINVVRQEDAKIVPKGRAS